MRTTLIIDLLEHVFETAKAAARREKGCPRPRQWVYLFEGRLNLGSEAAAKAQAESASDVPAGPADPADGRAAS